MDVVCTDLEDACMWINLELLQDDANDDSSLKLSFKLSIDYTEIIVKDVPWMLSNSLKFCYKTATDLHLTEHYFKFSILLNFCKTTNPFMSTIIESLKYLFTKNYWASSQLLE